MKVAFNVSALKNDHQNRGTGTYTSLLLRELKKMRDSIQILEFAKDVPQEADLVHYPFYDPFFLTLPINRTIKSVVTVHDLIPLKFPDKFPRGIRGEIKWQIQKYSLLQSQAIITDSKSSANDISSLTGFAKEKTYIIPLAVNEIFEPITDKTQSKSLKSKYNLPDSYLLYVGDVNWNKNIPGLIKSFASLKEQAKLVLVGGSFKNDSLKETKEINDLITKLGLEGYVIKLGFVPEADLVGIYNRAKVYVQPSFYEGFGLPVLEALSCGCPVACSSSSSLPEVGGEAVSYFNPNSEQELVQTIDKILRYDTAQYHSVVENGLKQAQKFSWKKTAKETLQVYERVCQS